MNLNKIKLAINYHLIDKWNFIYLEIDLTKPTFSLPGIDIDLRIWIAEKKDIPKIKTDIGEHLAKEDEKQIQRIGEEGFCCFVAAKNEKIIHFFLVYEKAIKSLLAQTPFDKKQLVPTDAYLGSAFTMPDARGLWVVPATLIKILAHLKESDKIKRALVLVHKDTSGAAGFYQRLGFNVVENPLSDGIMYSVYKWVSFFLRK
jgi:hypothetical protein